jgi:AcrR family transcriptional regulator
MKQGVRGERRSQLLGRVADYILSNGLADLSLRPLAAALKTSPRMLLYFFGSKEQLISEALTQLRSRQQLEFARAILAPTGRRRRLSEAWEIWSSPEGEHSLWLFFEIYSLALRDRKRFPGMLERLVKDWLPFFEHGFAAAGVAAERVQPLATLSLAAVRGLLLDLLATGERTRTDAAFRELLQLLASLPVSAPPPTAKEPVRKKR